MTTLLDASTFANEPLLMVVGIIAFAVLIFLGIRGKLRDWLMR